MIVDRLENASLYGGLGKRIAAGLQMLRDKNVLGLAVGKHELRGQEIFAMVQEYAPKAKEQGKWEAHRKYIDIQYISQGLEQMGWANVNQLEVSEPYDAQKEAAFYRGRGSFVTVPAGSFAIFFPEDAHMPGIATDQPGAGAAAGPGAERVRKIVLKVLIG